MDASVRLAGLARATRWLAWAAMVGYTLSEAWLLVGLWPNALAWTGVPHMSLSLDLDSFQEKNHWAPLMAEIPAWVIMMFGLARLSALMRLYERNQPFDPRAVVFLRQFAIALVANRVFYFLADPAIRLIYDLAHPLGPKAEIALHSSDLWDIYISVVFLLLSRVIAKAYFIAEDNSQIV
jgi:hypothetical protein